MKQIIFSFFFILSLASSAQKYTTSDINCDGMVNSADVVEVYNTIINGDTSDNDIDYTQAKSFTVNGVTFQMNPVEGGVFTMGASPEQTDVTNFEKPAHQVFVSSYFIGTTEVTQALWKAVTDSLPSIDTAGDDVAVYNINWSDCIEFVSRLNILLKDELDGLCFSLPSEAQWEYAARGGKNSMGYIYSGGNDLSDVAWYAENSSNHVHSVAQKKCNELGLYDMSGNVMEWTGDWYAAYKPDAVADPVGPMGGRNRISRGGSYRTGNNYCNVIHRSSSAPGKVQPTYGLRLVLCEL